MYIYSVKDNDPMSKSMTLSTGNNKKPMRINTSKSHKIKNKYNKITVNFINLVKLLFDELSLLEALILL